LSAESAARVRAEIHEHYQSAYEAALAGGSPGQKAALAAVAALGDARTANRQYRRVLLTSREAKTLQLMTPHQSSLPARRLAIAKWLMGLVLAWGIGCLAVITWKHHAWLIYWLTFAAVFLAPQFLPIDSPSRSRTYLCAKWVAFIGAAALTAWFGVMPLWVPLGSLLPLAYGDYVHTSIRRKLPVDQWPKRLYR
jgi:hypothetical protein